MAAVKEKPGTPAGRLEALAANAVELAQKARRNRQNLAGHNFYGNKLAELRADAANAFGELSAHAPGDTTALAELVDVVFGATTAPKARLDANRELAFALKTTWNGSSAEPAAKDPFFPLTILTDANRGYITTVGRQMNGCFEKGWYDACAVMMRRLVEISLIEAFEHKGVADKIKDKDGNYVQLTEMISRALAEPKLTLSRNCKNALPRLRDVGHMSAHGRYFIARPEDLRKAQPDFRVAVEELLHHGGLL